MSVSILRPQGTESGRGVGVGGLQAEVLKSAAQMSGSHVGSLSRCPVCLGYFPCC